MVVRYNIHWVVQGVGHGEIVLIGRSVLALALAYPENNDAFEYRSHTIRWLLWYLQSGDQPD